MEDAVRILETIDQMRQMGELTQELRQPRRLVVVLDRHGDSVEEHQDNDEPIKPLLLHRVSNFESAPSQIRQMKTKNKKQSIDCTFNSSLNRVSAATGPLKIGADSK